MSDEDNRVIGSDALPAFALPVDAVKVLSGVWIPAKRYVAPHYEMVVSEHRKPDDRWIDGYRNRHYAAFPHFAIVNTQPKTAHLYVSFMKLEGGSYVDMAYEGSLEPWMNVKFNVADHPKLTLPQLPATVTEADLLWVREGWLDILSSVEVQLDAWLVYFEKPWHETSGYRWVRTLPVQESSFIRPDVWLPKKDVALGPM